jgi:ethanolamine utilization cobalamin adenosyltransferase
MLYTAQNVRDNIRNKDGKRVFYLGKGDSLTSEARDFLQRERIEILPGEKARPEEYRALGGGYFREKPEDMTHLNGDFLVKKTHPRIAFRGAIDTLEAELLLAQVETGLIKPLQDALNLARTLIAADVLEKEMQEMRLGGMDAAEVRKRSHFPQDFYGIPHFMPDASDGIGVLRLNRCRCAARQAELYAVAAFADREGNCKRPDMIRAINRLSSYLYLLMIEEKAKSR